MDRFNHIINSLDEEKIIQSLRLDVTNDIILWKDGHQNTALHIATRKEFCKLVLFLLEVGLDKNATNECGLTSLHIAIKIENYQLLSILLSNSVDLNVPISTDLNRTALHLAVNSGNLTIVEMLVRRGINMNAIDNMQERALPIALLKGHFDIAKFLLEQEILQGSGQRKGAISNLSLAAYQDSAQQVENILKENTFSLNETNMDGFTPIMIAICSENIPVLNYLLSQKSINLQLTVPSSGFSVLHIAAATNKSAQVTESLLKYHSINVNAVDKTGRTPLHIAAHSGNRDIVKLLLRKNAVIDAQTMNGDTAMHFAAKAGHISVIDKLSQKKAKLEVETKLGYCPIHYAAAENRAEVVDFLIKKGVQIESKVHTGLTPLILAAENGGLESIDKLLKKLPINSLNVSEALYSASDNGHMNIVEFLVKRGVAIDGINSNNGYTPCFIAVEKGFLSIVDLLRANGANLEIIDKKYQRTMLLMAVYDNQYAMVECLLKNGAVVEVREPSTGYTGLYIAAQKGYTDIVQLLLAHHACPDTLTKNGDNPLFVAYRLNRKTILSLLFANMASSANTIKHLNVNDIDPFTGKTALYIAAEQGYHSVVMQLLKKGANPEIFEKQNGYTTLHIASQEGNCDVIHSLLSHDANIEAKSKFTGLTALHISIKAGQVSAVMELLHSGANIEAIDEDTGSTPLTIACEEGSHEIANLLLSKGANIDVVLKNGESVFDVITAKGNSQLLDSVFTFALKQGRVEYLLHHKSLLNQMQGQFKSSKNERNAPDSSFRVNHYQSILSCLEEAFLGGKDTVTVHFHIIGDGKAGKTVLIQYFLKILEKGFNRTDKMFKKEIHIDLESGRTRGIDISTIVIESKEENKIFNMIIYDYGCSRDEYLYAYMPFLSLPNSFYILMVPLLEVTSITPDRTNGLIRSEAQIMERIDYWLKLLYSIMPKSWTYDVATANSPANGPSSGDISSTISNVPLLVIVNKFTQYVNTLDPMRSRTFDEATFLTRVQSRVEEYFLGDGMGYHNKSMDTFPTSNKTRSIMVMNANNKEDVNLFANRIESLIQDFPSMATITVAERFRVIKSSNNFLRNTLSIIGDRKVTPGLGSKVIEYVLTNIALATQDKLLISESQLIEFINACLVNFFQRHLGQLSAYKLLLQENPEKESLLRECLLIYCFMVLIKVKPFLRVASHDIININADGKEGGEEGTRDTYTEGGAMFYYFTDIAALGKSILGDMSHYLTSLSATRSAKANVLSSLDMMENNPFIISNSKLVSIFNEVHAEVIEHQRKVHARYRMIHRGKHEISVPVLTTLDMTKARRIPISSLLSVFMKLQLCLPILSSPYVTLAKEVMGYMIGSTPDYPMPQQTALPPPSLRPQQTANRIIQRGFALLDKKRSMFLPGYFLRLFALIQEQIAPTASITKAWKNAIILTSREKLYVRDERMNESRVVRNVQEIIISPTVLTIEAPTVVINEDAKSTTSSCEVEGVELMKMDGFQVTVAITYEDGYTGIPLPVSPAKPSKVLTTVATPSSKHLPSIPVKKIDIAWEVLHQIRHVIFQDLWGIEVEEYCIHPTENDLPAIPYDEAEQRIFGIHAFSSSTSSTVSVITSIVTENKTIQEDIWPYYFGITHPITANAMISSTTLLTHEEMRFSLPIPFTITANSNRYAMDYDIEVYCLEQHIQSIHDLQNDLQHWKTIYYQASSVIPMDDMRLFVYRVLKVLFRHPQRSSLNPSMHHDRCMITLDMFETFSSLISKEVKLRHPSSSVLANSNHHNRRDDPHRKKKKFLSFSVKKLFFSTKSKEKDRKSSSQPPNNVSIPSSETFHRMTIADKDNKRTSLSLPIPPPLTPFEEETLLSQQVITILTENRANHRLHQIPLLWKIEVLKHDILPTRGSGNTTSSTAIASSMLPMNTAAEEEQKRQRIYCTSQRIPEDIAQRSGGGGSGGTIPPSMMTSMYTTSWYPLTTATSPTTTTSPMTSPKTSSLLYSASYRLKFVCQVCQQCPNEFAGYTLHLLYPWVRGIESISAGRAAAPSTPSSSSSYSSRASTGTIPVSTTTTTTSTAPAGLLEMVSVSNHMLQCILTPTPSTPSTASTASTAPLLTVPKNEDNDYTIAEYKDALKKELLQHEKYGQELLDKKYTAPPTPPTSSTSSSASASARHISPLLPMTKVDGKEFVRRCHEITSTEIQGRQQFYQQLLRHHGLKPMVTSVTDSDDDDDEEDEVEGVDEKEKAKRRVIGGLACITRRVGASRLYESAWVCAACVGKYQETGQVVIRYRMKEEKVE